MSTKFAKHLVLAVVLLTLVLCLPASGVAETQEWTVYQNYREDQTLELWFWPGFFGFGSTQQFVNEHFIYDWNGNGTIEAAELNENISIEWSGAECTEADTAFGNRGDNAPGELRAAIESATSSDNGREVILTLTNKVNGNSMVVYFIPEYKPLIDVKPTVEIDGVSVEYEKDVNIPVKEDATVTITANAGCVVDGDYTYQYKWNSVHENSEWTTLDCTEKSYTFTMMHRTATVQPTIYMYDANGRLVDLIEHTISFELEEEDCEIRYWRSHQEYRENETVEFWFEPQYFDYNGSLQFLNENFFFDWDGNGTIETAELNENVSVKWTGAECTEADTAFGNRGVDHPFALRAAIESATSSDNGCEVILTLRNKENRNAMVITFIPGYRPLVDEKPTLMVDKVNVDYNYNHTISVGKGAAISITSNAYHVVDETYTYQYKWFIANNNGESIEQECTEKTFDFTMMQDCSVESVVFIYDTNGNYVDEIHHMVFLHAVEARPKVTLDLETSHPVVGDVMTVAEGDTVTIKTNPTCTDPTIELINYWSFDIYDENGDMIGMEELDETGPTLTFVATAEMNGNHIYGEVYGKAKPVQIASFEYTLNVVPAASTGETMEYRVRSEFNLGENPEIRFDPNSFYEDYREYLFDKFICDWDGNGAIEADELNERISIEWSGVEFDGEPDTQFGNREYHWVLEAAVDSPTEDVEVKLVLTNKETGDRFIYTYELDCSYLYSKPVQVTVNGQSVAYENGSIEVPTGATITLTVLDEYLGSREHTYAYIWEARENGEQTELPITGNTYTFTMGSERYSVSCQTTLRFEDGLANASSYHTLHFNVERPDIILNVQTSHSVEEGVLSVIEGDLVTIAANPSCVDSTIEFNNYWEIGIFDAASLRYESTVLDEEGSTLTFEATANMDGGYIYYEVYANGADYAWFEYTLNVLPADYSIELSEQLLEMTMGESATLEAILTPSASASILWNSSDPAVVQVDQNGQLQAVAAGTAVVSASYGEKATASCQVVVHSSRVYVLPEKLLTVDASSFANVAAEEIILPETVRYIGAQAFAGNSQLKLAAIPGANTVIEQGAFANCPNVTLLCSENSAAMIYAQAEGIPYIVMD